jgi:hypothetical protein
MSCSFCNSRSHNINGCYDPMIDMLYERIKLIYVDIMTQNPIGTEFAFKSVLNRRFTLRELRAVSVKFLNAIARNTKCIIIDIIYEYFRSRIYHQEQRLLEVRRLPTQPDPIPEFARDLEQDINNEDSEEPNITWYIDRTPSTSSITSLIFPPEIRGERNIYHNRLVEEPRNSSLDFDAVTAARIIIQASQIKKYNIFPMLVQESREEGFQECAICYENIQNMDLVKLNCEHKFCGICIKKSLNAHRNINCGPTCALCRKPMVSFSVKNPEIYDLVAEHCIL